MKNTTLMILCGGKKLSFQNRNNNPWFGKERYSDKEFHGRPKRVMCIETGEVFESAKEASDKMKVIYSAVCAVCNGKRKTTGGYSFKFI